MPPWGRLEHTVWVRAAAHAAARPDGLRVASPLMMLFRLARTFNQHRFERAAEDCWHKKLHHARGGGRVPRRRCAAADVAASSRSRPGCERCLPRRDEPPASRRLELDVARCRSGGPGCRSR